jgi:1-acyl-sn-glycerol-3-phosphate acyltransferase
MVKKAGYFLSRNVCVTVFPEGTRTPDGQIHRFKDGAFVLAKLTHTAILPVVMNGNFDVMPKKGNRIKPKQDFHIKVLPEISVEEVDNTSVKELAQKMYDVMLSEHKKVAPDKYNV